MMRFRGWILLGAVLCMAPACGEGGATSDEEQAVSIDQRSFRLGSIAVFAEMVDAGVKQLGLSAPMLPAEMDALEEEARRIAAEHGVELYRETDFLVTDLFSSELTDGLDVLVITSAARLQEYLDLKAAKEELVSSGAYEGEARLEIARRFGGLLSYSNEKIAALLEAGDSRENR
ncbi:hypothetical protein ACGF5M_03355 [Gemmatimonadota bacterium]